MTETATPMVATTPEETSQRFADAVNANDLDALMTMYEPGASSAISATESVSGLEAIRAALDAGVFALRPTMQLSPIHATVSGEVALVIGDWSMTGTGPDGGALELKGRYADVVRRQADGRWLFIADNPWVG